MVKKVNNINTADTSNLVKELTITQKLLITIMLNILLLFNKLASKDFDERLAQANLSSKIDICNFVKKTDFDDKLKNLSKKVTSNKTTHVLAENELDELSEKVNLLSTKDYSFFVGRLYFTSDDGSQKFFVYQPTFNVLEDKSRQEY